MRCASCSRRRRGVRDARHRAQIEGARGAVRRARGMRAAAAVRRLSHAFVDSGDKGRAEGRRRRRRVGGGETNLGADEGARQVARARRALGEQPTKCADRSNEYIATLVACFDAAAREAWIEHFSASALEHAVVHQRSGGVAAFLYEVVCAFVIQDLNGLLERHVRKASAAGVSGRPSRRLRLHSRTGRIQIPKVKTSSQTIAASGHPLRRGPSEPGGPIIARRAACSTCRAVASAFARSLMRCCPQRRAARCAAHNPLASSRGSRTHRQ